jgi:iron complex outermembrane receptor protein
VDALIGGVDVTAFYKLNNYFGLHATAAYIYGQNTDEGEALIDIPAPVFTYSLTFQKEDWYQFVASFTGETVLKQTRYPDNNFIVPILVDGSFVDTEVNISEPPSGYQLFHFNAEMKFDLSNKLQLDTDFSIKNIFDISYRDYLNRQRFFADDLGRNFVLSIKLNY